MSLQFTVPDMCCDGCARSITKILQAVDADAKVATDLANQRLTVETTADQAKVVAALEKGGFPPDIA